MIIPTTVIAIRKILANEESKSWSTEIMLMIVPIKTKHPFEIDMVLRIILYCPLENNFLALLKRFALPEIRDTFSCLKMGMEISTKNIMIPLMARFRTNSWDLKLSTSWVILSSTNRSTVELPQEEPLLLPRG